MALVLTDHNFTNTFLENRIVDGKEVPLNLQLNYGVHPNYMELRIVQLRDSLSAPPLASVGRGRSGSRGASADSTDSDETLSEGSNPNLVPKEEGKEVPAVSIEMEPRG